MVAHDSNRVRPRTPTSLAGPERVRAMQTWDATSIRDMDSSSVPRSGRFARRVGVDDAKQVADADAGDVRPAVTASHAKKDRGDYKTDYPEFLRLGLSNHSY